MRAVEQRAARRLVDAARLHADQTILDEIDDADAVLAADRVERRDELDGVEPLAVHRDRRALLETDDDRLGEIRAPRTESR